MGVLTGKCEQDFKKYLCDKSYYIGTERLAYSFLATLYVEFFDSVKIYISTPPRYDGEFYFEMFEYHILNNGNGYVTDTFFKDRKSALIAAIEKSNEIYNKQC